MRDDGEPFSFDLREVWQPEVLQEGFTAVPNLLLRMRERMGLTVTDLYVLTVLLSYRWDNWNKPFPSLSALAKKTSLSPRHVARSTARLEELGLIIKHRRYGSSNEYDLEPLNEWLIRYREVYKDKDK